MKTLKDHMIIYDDECPMCDLYTGAFITTGMLENNGRIPYSKADESLMQNVDKRKACDKIALVNTKTGAVTYGLRSLTKILGHRFPLARPVFRSTTFQWVMEIVYGLISYNRKVIIPGRQFEAYNSCTPTFHLGYRWAYILFAWLASSLILNAYTPLLMPLVPAGNFYRELLVCAGQIVFQGAMLLMMTRDREMTMHYLGNMMTISLAGSLLLLPAWLVSSYVHAPFFFVAWFMTVVTLMLLEHMRRIKLLYLYWGISASWVIYRLVVLKIIGVS
ncbi:MAG: DUF393 domain-containing protein [Bacteroidota bacterium]